MTKTTAQKTHSAAGSTSPATTAAEEAEALSRVRDLLFGETAREHSDQLQVLQEQIDHEVEALRAEYEVEMASLRAEMKREFDSLRWQLNDLATAKVARQDLGAILTEMADRLATVG
ncbi:hypothetical protein Poly30_43630 [Planctomycetes bacterium Poly30]|uniref:Uncharacterized protein n=1 Tax=Saltatorellus ferox TaxID=2528018 RepID=A0A518EXJ6_9BACT|nr:hypothetical protein Poly30_43630 [Planctomycetes bacterium Poly30]